MARGPDRLVDLPRLRRLLNLPDLALHPIQLATLVEHFDLLPLLLDLGLNQRLIDVLVLQRIHALLLELQIRAHGGPSVRAFEGPLADLARRRLRTSICPDGDPAAGRDTDGKGRLEATPERFHAHISLRHFRLYRTGPARPCRWSAVKPAGQPQSATLGMAAS
ncbi:MAG: hypothetical protein FJ284_04760 [Planctomycetes bacterium]|nr:hypothetical protein [Planctomycetota bacterium]